MIFKAHNYQIAAAQFLAGNPQSALFADPGTGKTAIILMLLSVLRDHPKPVLITAPLRIVMDVWPAEIAKWGQFNHFSYEIIHGKKKGEDADRPADLHIINNEGLKWLADSGRLTNYRTLIIDESSKFKNWSAQRTQLLKKCIKKGVFQRRHILTGSPTPRSLLDLFAQMYLADGGTSLGQYITHYRHNFFIDKGYGVYPDWHLRPGADKTIYDAISSRCFRLDASKILDLPPLIVNDLKVDVPQKLIKESLKALQKAAAENFQLMNAGGEYIAARRITGGCINGEIVHDVKIKALQDLLGELQGKPALVFYYFREEGKRLAKILKAPRIDGSTTPREGSLHIRRWNARKLPVLLLQPAAAGHGLNLQDGGNDIIWYTLTDNQDDYYQANRRIYRQGVKGQVRVHRILAKNSVDIAVARSLEAKTNQQQALLDAIRELTT